VADKPLNDWEGKFGVRFDELVEIILGRTNGNDGWLDKPFGEFTPEIVPDEKRDFGIDFNQARSRFLPAQFDLIFNYQGERKSVRLHDVFVEHQGQGLGANILIHTAKAALRLGCDKVFAEPADMGSYYWPRHGAVILEWPESKSLDVRFKKIFEDPDYYLSEWKKKDIQWLQKIFEEKTPRDLASLTARSDLFVAGERLDQYLLHGVPLGTCVFDFNDDWTLTRLKEKLGFDVKKYKAEVKKTKRPQPKNRATRKATNEPL
jgi:hypothetical protein